MVEKHTELFAQYLRRYDEVGDVDVDNVEPPDARLAAALAGLDGDAVEGVHSGAESGVQGTPAPPA